MLTTPAHTHRYPERGRNVVVVLEGDSTEARLQAEREAGAVGGGCGRERDVDAVVAEALDALPDEHREVVTPVNVEGPSYQEAADVLRVPTEAIMSRLHRARARIRGRLATAGLAPLGKGM